MGKELGAVGGIIYNMTDKTRVSNYALRLLNYQIWEVAQIKLDIDISFGIPEALNNKG